MPTYAQRSPRSAGGGDRHGSRSRRRDSGRHLAVGGHRRHHRPFPDHQDCRGRVRLRLAHPSGGRDRAGSARLLPDLPGQLHAPDPQRRRHVHRDPVRAGPRRRDGERRLDDDADHKPRRSTANPARAIQPEQPESLPGRRLAARDGHIRNLAAANRRGLVVAATGGRGRTVPPAALTAK
jgi:hypothetical protein